MPLQKTDAIILKSQKLGETSKILTLFTRTSGIMKVVAKGARGMKSRFYGSLEPFNYISVVFYFKENRGLQLLTQADIQQQFKHIRTDLDKIALTSVVFEMVLKTQYADDPNPALFKQLLQYLNDLEQAPANFENYFFKFLLKFLQITGFKPNFEQCARCGKSCNEPHDYSFSVSRGSVFCHRCKSQEASGITVSVQTVRYLTALEGGKGNDLSKIAVPKATIRDGAKILYRFMNYHIEGLTDLRSMEFLGHIRSNRN